MSAYLRIVPSKSNPERRAFSLSASLLLALCLGGEAIGAIQPRPGPGPVDLTLAPRGPIQMEVGSECPANAPCVVQNRALVQVGGLVTLHPQLPRSMLLLECTFQAHVQLIREANSLASFQIQELNPNGNSTTVGGAHGLYAVLSGYGAGVGAPVSIRAVIARAGQRDRSFGLFASTSGYNVVPQVTISNKVCTITEIAQ